MRPIAPDTLLQQRYRILNILGDGAFGRTYLATDRGRSDAYCAIEELTPSAQFPSTVAKSKELFKQEAAILYQLEHFQLPRFWTTFEEQNRLLLVRDYIPGKTYRQILDDRLNLETTFTEAEVWRFLLQILPAIGYAHSKGAIHRNLSPEHIVYRESDGLPVPIDFGVVKEFANKLQADPASQHVSVGQPGYSPVEQLKQGQVFPHSDLYALAVTAIVLLTGKEPSALFEGDRMNWDWRRWTQIDDGFANVLGKMLESNPDDRYQSAIEVEQALEPLKLSNSEPANPSLNPDLLSEPPTVVVGDKNTTSVGDRLQTAITNLNAKTIWEKPLVLIPVALSIALLAGIGSWLGVTQLMHSKPPEPVATTPPKQIDFNNPTIPKDTETSGGSSGEIIQPEMDRPIVKEGKVDVTTPIRYRISAIAGENLDIQLVPISDQNPAGLKTDLPVDLTQIPTGADTPKPSPISPLKPSPNPTKNSKSTNPPIQVPTPLVATQVLMTILSPTGAPIDDRADRVVSWRGQLTTSGDYTIELRPIKGLAGNIFPYKLSVTQLSVTPTTSPSPTPSPTETTTPETGSTPPLGIPIPIGGAGIQSIPANPKPTNDLPGIVPTPQPIEIPTVTPQPVPTESDRPARNRRRNRAESESSPRTGERKRVESSEEPTPPRKRKRVESTEEPTPPRRRKRVESTEEPIQTPRRSRNRQPAPDPESNPNPNSFPKSNEQDNGTGSTPKSEPSKTAAPTSENSTPQPAKPDGGTTAPPLGSGTNDPD
jgi:serine/threonine protein kinase